MDLVLVSAVSGLALGGLLGGRLANLARLEIRFGWVLLVAVALQLVVVLRLARDPSVPLAVAGAGLAASYLAALGVCWLNRRLWAMRVVGLGILLNLLAAVPQGGMMPTTPEALRLAGQPAPAVLPPPSARPYVLAKDVVLGREKILLWPLSDWLVIPAGLPLAGVFSPGDVVVAAGLSWLLAGSMRSGKEPTLAGDDGPLPRPMARSTSTR